MVAIKNGLNSSLLSPKSVCYIAHSRASLIRISRESSFFELNGFLIKKVSKYGVREGEIRKVEVFKKRSKCTANPNRLVHVATCNVDTETPFEIQRLWIESFVFTRLEWLFALICSGILTSKIQ